MFPKIIDNLLAAATVIVLALVLVLNLSLYVRLAFLIILLAVTTNLYIYERMKSRGAAPLWIVAVIPLIRTILSQFLPYDASLLIAYIVTLIIVLASRPGTLRVLDDIKRLELLLITIVVALLVSAVLGVTHVSWILLGPITDLLLINYLLSDQVALEGVFGGFFRISVAAAVGLAPLPCPYLITVSIPSNYTRQYVPEELLDIHLILEYLVRLTSVTLLWSTGMLWLG